MNDAKMTSVDSGVDTGNDSNDGAAQPEHQKIQRLVDTVSMDIRQEQNTELNVMPIDPPGPSPTTSATGTVSRITTCFDFSHPSRFKPMIILNGLPDSQNKFFEQGTWGYWESRPESRIVSRQCRQRFDPIRNRRLCYQDEFKIKRKCSPLTEADKKEIRTFYGLERGNIHLGAGTNNLELVQRLLERGVSPNNRDSSGRSPLHLAASRGYTDMVKLLLDYGANPNLTDCIGNTPLHLAAATSKLSVVQLLLNAGTNISSADRHGYNPLQLAETKLRLLQNCKGSDMNIVKDEVQKIVGLIWLYLQKQKKTSAQIDTLTSFCSRISLSNSSDQVQDDLKGLLASIDSLSLK